MKMITKFKRRLLNRHKIFNGLKVSMFLSLLILQNSAIAAMQLELIGTYPQYTGIRVTGNVNDVPVGTGTAGNAISFSIFNVEPSTRPSTLHINASFPGAGRLSFSEYRSNIVCPRSLSAWRSYINSYLNGKVVPVSGIYPNEQVTTARVSLDFGCIDTSPGVTYSMHLSISTPGYDIGVINPPNPSSVCTLNNQNLTYNYSSSSLNMNGASLTRTARINCTTGTAQNYRLRLTTGVNTVNGRLSFGNGVSAQISLNGTQVSANGSGISLSRLTSQTISVNSTLVGTASGSGTTNTSGVLVLEAL